LLGEVHDGGDGRYGGSVVPIGNTAGGLVAGCWGLVGEAYVRGGDFFQISKTKPREHARRGPGSTSEVAHQG
jgi:hypothetical protein